jgi:hypothetical protein
MSGVLQVRVPFWRASRYCLLALFRPEEYEAAEKAYNNALRDRRPRSPGRILHSAFWGAARLVVVSGIAGALIGAACAALTIKPLQGVISTLQAAAALLLLWATLAVRSLEIRTWGGISLTERVNQWLYRSMYFLATLLLVWSVVWPVMD